MNEVEAGTDATAVIEVTEGAKASFNAPTSAPVAVVAAARASGSVATIARPATAHVGAAVTPGAAVVASPRASSDVTFAAIPGPEGPPGPTGPAGPPGDGTSASYRHVQMTPSDVWTIPHNLGFYPAITTVDSTNRVFLGEVAYVDFNTVVVTLSAATAGEAFLS